MVPFDRPSSILNTHSHCCHGTYPMPTGIPRKGSFLILEALSTQLQLLQPHDAGGAGIDGMEELFLPQGLLFILFLHRLSFMFMSMFGLHS